MRIADVLYAGRHGRESDSCISHHGGAAAERHDGYLRVAGGAFRACPASMASVSVSHPELSSNAEFYGASPCTNDRKIHYLTGVARGSSEGPVRDELLSLEAGEYAVVRVEDTALLRDTWTWLLGGWLPTSGRREKRAPEFERYTGISEAGLPVGPVEIWIPLEPLATPIR